MIRGFTAIAAVGCSAIFIGCAKLPQSQVASAYAGSPDWEERFDPWRACSRATEQASKGNAEALRTCFLAAYVRVSQPFMGGEDLMQMRDNFNLILKTLGDQKFAAALKQQRPEVQSAVKWFFDLKAIAPAYPETSRLLERAPHIDWPLTKAYESS